MINNTTYELKTGMSAGLISSESTMERAMCIFRRTAQIALFAAVPVLVGCSDICTRAASGALSLCAKTVIPSLFPYLVLTALISSSGAARLVGRIAKRPFSALFGIDGALCSAFLIGTVSGYPAGASAAAQIYRSGACKQEDAERVLAFCNNTGPAFLIGGIGAGMLGSPALGTVIYASQLCAAVLCGILFRPRGRYRKESSFSAPTEKQSVARQFTLAISGAASTMLAICAFIVFFAVVGSLTRAALNLIGIKNKAFYALLLSFFELTGGAAAASGAGAVSALICSAAVGWSGLSVLFQTRAVLEGSGLSMKYYIAGKALQAVLCPVFTAILLAVSGISPAPVI